MYLRITWHIQTVLGVLWRILMDCSTSNPTKRLVRRAKTQISLGIRPVWSEFSMSTWRNFLSLATHWVHSEDPDQTCGCPGWPESLLSACVILLGLSCTGSIFRLYFFAAPCTSSPPHVHNGMRIFVGKGHGFQAKYRCFPGFKLTGMNSSYLMCNYGEWVGGHPHCQECKFLV